MKRRILSLIVTALLFSLSMLYAQEGEEEQKNSDSQGMYLNTNLGASVNSLGLAWKADVFYRIPLVDKPGVLWETTKLDIGVQQYLSPAFERASAFVRIEPIAFFDVVAYAGYDYMYGGNGKVFAPGMLKLSSPDDDYSSDTRKEMDGEAKGGLRVVVVPTFKIAFGPVAALYSWSINYHDYDYEGYYYDAETYIAQKGKDAVYTHDAKVLYKLGPFPGVGVFRLGVNYTDSRVGSTDDRSSKLAGMVVYQAKWKSLSATTSPYFVTMLGTHLEDRYYENKVHFALLMGVTYKL